MPPNDIQNLLVFAYLSIDFLWLLYKQTSAELLTLEGGTLSPVPPPLCRGPPPPMLSNAICTEQALFCSPVDFQPKLCFILFAFAETGDYWSQS